MTALRRSALHSLSYDIYTFSEQNMLYIVLNNLPNSTINNCDTSSLKHRLHWLNCLLFRTSNPFCKFICSSSFPFTKRWHSHKKFAGTVRPPCWKTYKDSIFVQMLLFAILPDIVFGRTIEAVQTVSQGWFLENCKQSPTKIIYVFANFQSIIPYPSINAF